MQCKEVVASWSGKVNEGRLPYASGDGCGTNNASWLLTPRHHVSSGWRDWMGFWIKKGTD